MREVNNVQPFQDKLVKLIPTEIVGAYLVIVGLVTTDEQTGNGRKYTLIGAFFCLLLFTPIYLWKVGRVNNKIQLLASTVSFVIWVYTLKYPFIYWGLYYSYVGAVVLVLWSLIIPIVVSPTSHADG